MNDNNSHYRNQIGKRLLTLAAALVLVATVAAGCGDDAGDTGISVVATTTILGDVAANVVGDEGTVEVLLPLGLDSNMS